MNRIKSLYNDGAGNERFYSHLETLKIEIDRLNKLNHKIRVLEWGSGMSTVLLCERLKEDSFILSIEHDIEYKLEIPEQYQSRLRQVILPTQKHSGCSKNYVTYPLLGYQEDNKLYDFIFIDGRNRADCLAVASMLLHEEGTAILHDSERRNYQENYPLFGDVQTNKPINSPTLTTFLKKPLLRLHRTK